MMHWLQPAAFAALGAAILPVVVHLLLRRRASRVLVPSVRFIAATEDSAVRVRRPSDLLLLAVRVAIVASAALALAGPLVITGGRRAAWDASRIRAIVIDRSASVDANAASEAARAESRDAAVLRTFEGTRVAAAVARAAAWLRETPPGRQEVVLISDFQHGAVGESDLAPVPRSAGIRTVRIGSRVTAGEPIDGGTIVWGPGAYAQVITVDDAETSLTLRNRGPAPDFGFLNRAGIFMPSEGYRVSTKVDSLDRALEEHARLSARPDQLRLDELEPRDTPPAAVERWTREPSPADVNAWRRSDEWDGRWLWFAALILLGLEAILRRERAKSAVMEAHAA